MTHTLENWGRWVRDRESRHHCLSIEHRYKSPQEWGNWEEAAPGTIPMPIDALDAIRSQKVVGSLAGGFAWALTFKFALPWVDRYAAARRCGVYRPEKLLVLQNKAEFAFTNRLHLMSVKGADRIFAHATKLRYHDFATPHERESRFQF